MQDVTVRDPQANAAVQNIYIYILLIIKGHCVLFFCFRSENNQNRMGDGGEKTFRKKNILNLFLKKLMRATK